MPQIEIDKLQQLADATDNANGAPLVDANGAEIPPPPPPIDYLNEAGAAVAVFAALAVGYAPAAARLWDEAAKHRIAAALAPVMAKYNFSLGAMPPEITLLIVAGPVLYQTSRIIASEMAEQKARPAPAVEQQPGRPPAPEQAGTDRTAGPMTAAHIGAQESPEILRSPQTALYSNR